MCFMQQDVKFTVCLTQIAWILALSFDITHTNKYTHAHTGANRLTHKYIYINTACYVFKPDITH